MGRRIAGLNASALGETVAFLAAALALDFWLTGGQRFTALSPHPFWIIVLMVATFYGTNEGLAAAVLSTVALLAWNVPEQGFDEDRSAWLLRVSVNPVLWVLSAIILGEIRSGLQRRYDRLHDDFLQARKEVSTITEAYERLAEIRSNLEVRVAAQVQTVQAMYRASRAIERQGTGEVLVGISDLCRSVMAPRKFSLFLLNGAVLEAGASEGWVAGDRFEACFDAASPLFQSVIVERRTLVVADVADEGILDGQGVLAGPLVSQDFGEIVGMLKIEELGFSGLHAAAVQNFKVLCDWIGTAYANAQRMEILAEGHHFDAVRRLLPMSLFEQQRSILVRLAQEIGFDACALYLGFHPRPQDGGAGDVLLARTVARAAEKILSIPDLRFDFRQLEWAYAILLPGMNAMAAEGVAARLGREVCSILADSGHAASPRFSVDCLHACGRAPRIVAGGMR
jgi:polysaccharide biosynthesis protein PelD